MDRLSNEITSPSGSAPAATQHRFSQGDIKKIMDCLGPAADRLKNAPTLHEGFLNYLALSKFKFYGQDAAAELQARLNVFVAMNPAAFGEQHSLIWPPILGSEASTWDLAHIAKNDAAAIDVTLRANPRSLLKVEPKESRDVFGRDGPVNAPRPFAGCSRLTYAVKQDPEAKGGLKTICMWVARERRANNPSLPADILNFTDAHGETALTTAVLSGASPACVQALVEAGANVNTPNARGIPPITLAVMTSNFALVTSLLSYHPSMPIGAADPLVEMDLALQKLVVYPKSVTLAQREETITMAARLLGGASEDLLATVEHAAGSPSDVAKKFLVRWKQAASHCLSIWSPIREAASAFCSRLPGLVPHAAETAFCHDMSTLGGITKCGQPHQLPLGFPIPIDWNSRISPSADSCVGNHNFDGRMLRTIAMMLSKPEYFKGKPELAARFLSILSVKNLNMDASDFDEYHRLKKELKQNFVAFKKLVAQEQKLVSIEQATAAESRIQIQGDQGEDPLPLMKALVGKAPQEQIRAILNSAPQSLAENVGRLNSRNWLYLIERQSRDYIDGSMSTDRYFQENLQRAVLTYVSAAPETEEFSTLTETLGASPLTFAVAQDPQASGALSTICMWIVAERGHNPAVLPDILDFTDHQGHTAMTAAVDKNHPACVDVLLESGASVNAPDARGRTPLMWAARAANEEMVTRLLADEHINAAAFNGDASAISLAVLNRSPDNGETMDRIIDALLEAAPKHLEGLLAGGKASPYEVATAFTDELLTWLSLAQSPNGLVRDAALANLRSLPAKAPNACATLLTENPKFGIELFSYALDTIRDLSCTKGDDLANLVEPIHASMWDQAIGAVDFAAMYDLLLPVVYLRVPEDDVPRYFAAHPGTRELLRRILAAIPEKGREALDRGDIEGFNVVARKYLDFLAQFTENPFSDEFKQCISGIEEQVPRFSAINETLRNLGAAGQHYLDSPELKSSFIAAVSQSGVDPFDPQGMLTLFNSHRESMRRPLPASNEAIRYV